MNDFSHPSQLFRLFPSASLLASLWAVLLIFLLTLIGISLVPRKAVPAREGLVEEGRLHLVRLYSIGARRLHVSGSPINSDRSYGSPRSGMNGTGRPTFPVGPTCIDPCGL
jgi:hypothetical protein